ncbi:MAG: hypothetical protein AMXMBFR81_23050 [Chthonomonas sp.]
MPLTGMAWFDSWIDTLDKWQILAVWVLMLAGWILNAIRWRLDRRRRAELARTMRAIGSKDSVAVLIRVGGAADPRPDVLKHLEAHCPGVSVLLTYDVPEVKPENAQAIAEDIRDGLREFVQGGATKPVLFFASGMLPFPFLVGATLANSHQVQAFAYQSGAYVSMFHFEPGFKTRTTRTAPSLAKWTTDRLPPRVAEVLPESA